VAAIVYEGLRRYGIIALTIGAALAQLPLHFMAKGTGLPLFHPPAQVISDAEFVVGVLVRVAVLAVASALFSLVGNGLRGSRRALIRSEATFRGAFEEAPIGVALVSEQGLILNANREVARLARGELRAGNPFHITGLFADVDAVAAGEAILDIVGDRAQRVELELESATSQSRSLRVAMVGVNMADRSIGAIVTIEDVTERVENRRRLEELVRSKDEFVASVSHELRTPLTAVVGFAEILAASWRELHQDELDTLIGDIARESGEVASIVEDLLVIARADIGRVTLIPDSLRIDSEVERVIAGFAPDEIERISVDVSGGTIWGDPIRLRQVLRNLVSNAIRYGGPEISIASMVVGDLVEVSVSDDGRGIPDDETERIFEPYVRAHRTPTQPASVGLGLAVARSLARAMGGELSYARVADTTCFTLSLPAADVPVGAG
jgi:signal transduction histidine kinase